jgi:hypothetical protein
MRLILFILVFLSVGANAQMVIKAHPNYVPLGITPILDIYTNAAGAYSLRKLRSGYTGAAIRIRKDTTGQPEQDINFVGNDLDTNSIKSFLNARNGFVVTWYDQSGNGLNVTQATQASQPQIAALGSIYYENNRPTILFDGSNDILERLNVDLFRNQDSAACYAVTRWISSPAVLRLLFFCSNNLSFTQTRYLLGGGNTANKYSIGSRRLDAGVTFVDNTTDNINTSNLVLQTGLVNYATPRHLLYINNIEKLTAIPGYVGGNTSNTTALKISIGGQTTAAANANARISEVIIYENLNNRSLIETNINNYYGIY